MKRVQISNHIMEVHCPKTKLIRIVKCLYSIDSKIEFIREFVYMDTPKDTKVLHFNLQKSNIPYLNIGNIVSVLMEL